ncbi:molybdenum cofactor biosynthesis protein C [Legionella jamestowniensis]|uniref:cyclic pyranopterin monophosphate synthase n=1 Tax=Legionella jamestowniensis TaxID=455 RepID=A0ABX2XVA2_9GAMM|nr:cyclic pyranopterin monophosphate synthase MoaC [Legionella jamestowniensis]OCH98515.1 molybdenum cofactor biosynthesis protein C [Legionella jamestowniensis]
MDKAKKFEKSYYKMIDISHKLITARTAIAKGTVVVGPLVLQHIQAGTMIKGDVLKIAEIAGINGAKTTFEHIPLCHPLMLDHVAIQINIDEKNSCLHVYCLASAEAKTGVEMEALSGVNAACLAIYDLSKIVQPVLRIENIHLIYKSGGKKDQWINPESKEDPILRQLSIVPPASSEKKLLFIFSQVLMDKDKEALQEAFQRNLKIAEEIITEAEFLSSYLTKLDDQYDYIFWLKGSNQLPEEHLTWKRMEGLSQFLHLELGKSDPSAWLETYCVYAIDSNQFLIHMPGKINTAILAAKALLSIAIK